EAGAQNLGHGEGGEEAIAGVRIGVRGPRVPRIAAHSRALAGHGDLQEGLTVEVRPAGIGDEAVGGAVPGMHVRVDEAGRHQSATGVDLGVDRALEAPTDMQDAVVLVHDHAVGMSVWVWPAKPTTHPPRTSVLIDRSGGPWI